MASGKHRKRLEVSEGLYYEIERLAIWLHMPVAKCAEMLLWDAVNRVAAAPRENTTSATPILRAIPSGGEGQK